MTTYLSTVDRYPELKCSCCDDVLVVEFLASSPVCRHESFVCG